MFLSANRYPSRIKSGTGFRRNMRLRSHLDALDRQALVVGGGLVGIEHLAVEERLLAARGRRRNVRGGDAESLGGLAPQILAVHFPDERLAVETGLVLA